MAKNTDRSSSSFGKPDATGRSSGKHAGRRGRIGKPPKGELWVWLTKELLESPAWRTMGVNARRLFDFLLAEHLNHAGTENGRLIAPYDQLVKYGLPRSEIRGAIDDLVILGHIDVEPGGRWVGSNEPSRYRLTLYPDADGNPATNDWKRITDEHVTAWRKRRRATGAARQKNRSPSSTSRTTVVRLPELRSTNRPPHG